MLALTVTRAAVDDERRRAARAQHALGHVGRVGLAVDVLEQDGELVAAQPRDRVLGRAGSRAAGRRPRAGARRRPRGRGCR